jgi:hypothetical protein
LITMSLMVLRIRRIEFGGPWPKDLLCSERDPDLVLRDAKPKDHPFNNSRLALNRSR